MSNRLVLPDGIRYDAYVQYWEDSVLPAEIVIHLARLDEARSALQGVDQILEADKLLTRKNDEGIFDYDWLDGATTSRLQAAKRILFREIERRMNLIAKFARSQPKATSND